MCRNLKTSIIISFVSFVANYLRIRKETDICSSFDHLVHGGSYEMLADSLDKVRARSFSTRVRVSNGLRTRKARQDFYSVKFL